MKADAQPGSSANWGLPLESNHLAPHALARSPGPSCSQLSSGTKPATLIEPSGLRTVSFLASAISSSMVFGGDEMPAFANMSLL